MKITYKIHFSFVVQVGFVNSNGTENLDPRPPFRIRVPRKLKGNTHALPGNKKVSVDSGNDVNTADDCKKEQLIVEAYVPPDPGPYPQDQPKQNSVRFTPTQVQNYLFMCFIFYCFISLKLY